MEDDKTKNCGGLDAIRRIADRNIKNLTPEKINTLKSRYNTFLNSKDIDPQKSTNVR